MALPMCSLEIPTPRANCPRPSQCAWKIIRPISTFRVKTARSIMEKGSSLAIATTTRKRSHHCSPLASASPTPPSATVRSH